MFGPAAVYTYHTAAPPVDERELAVIRDAMVARWAKLGGVGRGVTGCKAG